MAKNNELIALRIPKDLNDKMRLIAKKNSESVSATIRGILRASAGVRATGYNIDTDGNIWLIYGDGSRTMLQNIEDTTERAGSFW